MSAAALLEAALFLAPALLLWALVALGRYPGEAALARLARRPPKRARRGWRSRQPRAPAARASAPRNLLACSLAGRGPPQAAQLR